MKAMILAAGRGDRLRPLTEHTPKPLLQIGDESLLERHLRRLSAAGFNDVVINVSHLGEVIEHTIGDGRSFGVIVEYSREPDGPLETAGGIRHALTQLGSEPFLVVNGDIWTDFEFADATQLSAPTVVLVPNPAHNESGDFDCEQNLAVRHGGSHRYTYAGIGVFDPGIFAALASAPMPLGPLLFELAAAGQLGARVHAGHWFDIGTPERLQQVREFTRKLARKPAN